MSTPVDAKLGYDALVSMFVDSGKKYCGEKDGTTVSIEAGGTNCGKAQEYMVAIPSGSA